MRKARAKQTSRKPITKSLSPPFIKQSHAYTFKAALSSHPDKVGESERAGAEVKFKSVSKAYEILYDDNKRHLYDTHGMSAFDGSHGPGAGAGSDIDEMLAQMFGMGGGMPSGFGAGAGAGPRGPRKGADEEHPYQVTLEDLYKGKTTKFASTKNVICSHCKGIGGKDKAKAKKCASCQGRGAYDQFVLIGSFDTKTKGQVSKKICAPLVQAWSLGKQPFAVPAKVKVASLTPKINVKNARVNV